MNFWELEPGSDEAEPDLRLPSLRERTPAEIERQVMELSVNSAVDDLAAAIDVVDWLLARGKTIDRLMRQIAISWIDRNGEFDIGEQHYSVGYSTVFKCQNVPQTGHAILDAAKGDVELLFSLLIAQPYKPASVRNAIDMKVYGSLFKAHRTGRLINGVPERILKRTDTRFVSPKR